MAALTCSLRDRTMEDLNGDVVADRNGLNDPNGVGRLRVICHPCLGQPATSERFQTMWGLAWLRGNDLGVARIILVAQADSPNDRHLSRQPIDDFVGLGDFLLPGPVPPEGDNAG